MRTDLLALADPAQALAQPQLPTQTNFAQQQPHRPDFVRDYGPTVAMVVGLAAICAILWKITGYFKTLEVNSINTDHKISTLSMQLQHSHEVLENRVRNLEERGNREERDSRFTPPHARVTMP